VSLATTEARSAARAAERAWRTHLADCARCSRASRRRYSDLCPDGAQARTERLSTAADLAEQVRLDQLPTAGQGALFGREEVEADPDGLTRAPGAG
jgi:hypothetical protein